MADSVSLDRFAPAYVPNWQRALPYDEQPVHLHPFVPISTRQYSVELFPTPLLDTLESLDEENMRYCAEQWTATLQALSKSPQTIDSQGNRTRRLPPLLPSNYVTRATLLQDSEYHARLATLKNSALYNVLLTPVPVQSHYDPTNGALFTLSTPHIRENYPPVSIHDTVWLRQLRPWSNSLQGFVFESRIHSIQRTNGTVTLQCDALAIDGMWESGLFNVEFVPQARQFTLCRKALESMQRGISRGERILNGTKTSSRPWPARWLFPETTDWDETTPAYQEHPSLSWIDPELNEEQQLAIKSIVHGKHTIPYLISGPPGTGKTKTIVEAIFQVLEHHSRTHILVCGASNSSADTLAIRLSQRLSPDDLFRMNDPSRPMDEVRVSLHPWCWSENGLWALPPIKSLLSKRVIVTSCVDASLLSSVRCSNSSLSALEEHIMSYLRAPAIPSFSHQDLHFGFLLVDEAGQASEMELCVPLSVVAPGSALASKKASQFDYPPVHITICGDVNQLGPRIESVECRNHDMDVSLLERLFDRDPYHLSPFSRKTQRTRRGDAATQVKQPISTPFCNLRKNYRSHPAILMLPSTLFYEDTLVALAPQRTQKSPLRYWPALRTQDFPLLFIGKSTPEEWTDQRLSFFNQGEITEIVAIIKGLLGRSAPDAPYFLPEQFRGGLAPNEISVISPFREQVWKIRASLRDIALGAVDVGDVEGLQGGENRVVIISTVRSSTRFLPDDQRFNRGVIYEAKRFNVALTRAKELLIIIGNGNVLKVDPWWKQLLTFVMRNDAYQGPFIESVDTSSAEAFSRLEEEWCSRHRERERKASGNSAGADGDVSQGFRIAGSLVREALHEGII